MNEQQIRDHERSKVIAYIRGIAQDLRQFDNEYDAKFLDEIISYLTHPDWVEDTKSFKK
jgi:hypothetical protein